MGEKVYGLLGRKLGHSWSAPIHAALGCADYRLIELEPEELGAFLAREDIGGLNVTIPYKRDVMAYCDVLDPMAEAIGSVNTLVRRADGKLYGYNTDAAGFCVMAQRAGIGFAGKKTLVLGSGAFIPGFEEQVVGMNIGEEKDITVKFPDDYHAENLKGKEAVFTVKLHEIKIKELPELNDEFIKDATGEESVEAYKASTMAKLKEANDKKAETETENKLLDAICATAEVEIPEVLVERQIDALVQDMEYRMMYSGLRLEDYLKYVGKTMEEYRQGFKEQATKQVKSQLVIDKIIRDENIAATEEEIDSQLEKMASDAGKTLAEYKEKLDDRQKDYVENNVIIEKLFKFLKENNEIA